MICALLRMLLLTTLPSCFKTVVLHRRKIWTLSIDNETDDDDVSQPRHTGPRVSFLAVQLPWQTTTFSLGRTLSCYSLISYDDGLIDDGEFFLFLDYSILEAVLFVRQLSFVFVLKLKVNNDLEQLLTWSYAKFRLLKRIQYCCLPSPYTASFQTLSVNAFRWRIRDQRPGDA